VTSPGSLSVTFCYNDYRDEDVDEAPCVPEPLDEADFAAFDEIVAANEDDVGKLVLRRAEVAFEIEDSLDATVANFCLGAIPDLVGRKHVVVRHFLSYGYLRLDPEASEMLISGDFVPKVRLPRAELIPALFGVGDRYVRFLERVRGNDAEYQGLIGGLREKRDLAAEALSTWDGE